MPYVIKAEVRDPNSRVFEFDAAKTMYGGRRISAGDTAFLFASENEDGSGLFARTIVTYAAAVPRVQDEAKQTPRHGREGRMHGDRKAAAWTRGTQAIQSLG
jgi:hypothetical protein